MKIFCLFVCCCLITSCNEREAEIAFRTLHALAVSAAITADIAAEIQSQNEQEVNRQVDQAYQVNHPTCQYEEFYEPRENGTQILCTRFVDCSVECDERKDDASTATTPSAPFSWQVREAAFLNLVQRSKTGDVAAQKEIDAYLDEYEKHPMAKTPMENLYILGEFYVPRDGVEKYLPAIVMNVALGWYDALRFGSESGRSEIASNRHFFKRAYIFGGKKTLKEVSDFLSKNPEKVHMLVDLGLEHAKKWRDASEYDHLWVTAFGLERTISSTGESKKFVPVPKAKWEECWDAAEKRVREYYGIK
jgi:hypothetical protein